MAQAINSLPPTYTVNNTDDYAVGTAGASVALGPSGTYAADTTGKGHVLEGIGVSLSAAPAAAVTVTITDGATVRQTYYLTQAGYQFIPVFKRFTANASLTITLSAPGGSIVGTLEAINHRLEA